VIELNIEIHADMDKEIYRKAALFINDVDFIKAMDTKLLIQNYILKLSKDMSVL